MSELPSILTASEAVVEVSSDHKPIQALAVDPFGARMVTGGVDGVMKYWDFAGMNGVEPRPFRELIPVPAHSINALSFNAGGSLVLCVTSDCKAKVFDREGTARPVEETIKGDQYIRTPENTKGHTHNLSYGEFHPSQDSRFMTCSYDSTVRLWDLHAKRTGMDQNIPNQNCFKCVDARGLCGGSNIFVSTAAYSVDGSQVMAGGSDGSLHLFNEKNKYGKGLQIVRSAHMGEITSLKFLFGDSQLVTRGMDDCVKFWDLRKFKEPLRTWSGIDTARSWSNVAISPDSNWLVFGTASGHLATVNLATGELAGRHKLATRQVVRVEWSPKLNQVISTAVDGNVFFSYSASESSGGALSFIHKLPSKRVEVADDRPTINTVVSYDELLESGEYRENKMGEIRIVKPKISIPQNSAVSASSAILTALEERRKAVVREDVQKKLLSFGVDEEDGMVGRAYKRTQPEPVLDFSDQRSRVDDLLVKKSYCTKCGLKICHCASVSHVTPSQGPGVDTKKFRH